MGAHPSFAFFSDLRSFNLSAQDYYQILSVTRTSTSVEIKKAYRKKALQYHPDKNPGDKEAEEKFKEATEAYSVLSDDANRQRYDQMGHDAFVRSGGAGGGGFGAGGFEGFEDIFGDIFSQFFGGSTGGRSSRGQAGNDLRYDMQISFEEAAFGIEKEIDISRRQHCDDCEGTGAKPGTSVESCKDCGGTGQVRMQQGFFTISRTCGRCKGSGQTISDPCRGCGGAGLKAVKSKLKVTIPAGIDHGQRLKLRGEGEAGSAGGPAGDLYVVVAVKEHAFFERHQSDVICEVKIPYTTAVLGAEIKVPTLRGEVSLKIPAGTPSGKIFRLKNKGIPILGTEQVGDQHVRVALIVPKKISEDHRSLLEELRDVEKADTSAEGRGFFDKVKEMFV